MDARIDRSLPSGRHRPIRLPVHHHGDPAARKDRHGGKHHRVLQRRRHGTRYLLPAEPHHHPMQRPAEIRGQRHRRLREPYLLPRQRHRPQGHRPRTHQQSDQGHTPRRFHHHPAVCGTVLSGRNHQLQGQDPGGHPRTENRADAEQGRGVVQLHEHHLPWPRRVWHPGGSQSVFQQERPGSDA